MLAPLAACLGAGLAASTAFATAQQAELLLYQGSTHYMFTLPLESYFGPGHPRPEFSGHSSGIWRGYVGRWAIVKGTLYLDSLSREGLSSADGEAAWKEMPLAPIFGDRPPPIPASWYSGVLRVPQGELLRYVHMGFASIYERDLYITVHEGRVVAERLVDNKGFGAARSAADLQWTALSTAPVADDGNWRDARLLETPAFADIRKSGARFVTRGLLMREGEGASLLIPETPTTRFAFAKLASLPADCDIRSGEHVELEARFGGKAPRTFLEVISIRRLLPGETIHHPDFQAPPERR